MAISQRGIIMIEKYIVPCRKCHKKTEHTPCFFHRKRGVRLRCVVCHNITNYFNVKKLNLIKVDEGKNES